MKTLQDLWFTKAETYARRRGLSTWPQGARWPAEIHTEVSPVMAEVTTTSEPTTSASEAPGPDETPEQAANRELAASQEEEIAGQTAKQKVSEEHAMPTTESRSSQAARNTDKDEEAGVDAPSKLPGSGPMSSAYVWIGSSTDTDGVSRVDEIDEETLASRDGIGIVYMPLIPNEKVPGFNPIDISTWRFELKPEETDDLLEVSKVRLCSTIIFHLDSHLTTSAQLPCGRG
jgi:cytosolic phospholipase A2